MRTTSCRTTSCTSTPGRSRPSRQQAGVPRPPGTPVGHLGLLQQRHPAQPEHLGPGERRRRRVAGARADARWHLLRRDRLREERGAAGGFGRERGRRCRPAVVVQRGGGAHGSDPVLGPDAESGWGVHESQPSAVSALCVQLLHGPVRAFGRAARRTSRATVAEAVTMGTTQGAEMAQFITYVACAGQSRMASLGYSPIPPNLVVDDFQAAGRLPGGTEPPAPTAQNCANPYITGALQPVGGPTHSRGAAPGWLRRYGRRGSRRRGGSSQRRRGSQCGKGRDDNRYRRGCRRFGCLGGCGCGCGSESGGGCGSGGQGEESPRPPDEPRARLSASDCARGCR